MPRPEIAAADVVSAPSSIACLSRAPPSPSIICFESPPLPDVPLSLDIYSPVCVSTTGRHSLLIDVLQPTFSFFGILPIGPGNGEDTVVLSTKPVATTKIPEQHRPLNRTNLVALATFSPHEGALLASGFSKAAATTAAPWMRLLGATSEKTQMSSKPRTVWATCTYRFERMCYHTDVTEMEPHPAFVSAVEHAVGADEADPLAQLAALRHVLAQWGPVFAPRTTVGCALRTSIRMPREPNEARVFTFAMNPDAYAHAATAVQRGGGSLRGGGEHSRRHAVSPQPKARWLDAGGTSRRGEACDPTVVEHHRRLAGMGCHHPAVFRRGLYLETTVLVRCRRSLRNKYADKCCSKVVGPG
jgi:hypothetical protein